VAAGGGRLRPVQQIYLTGRLEPDIVLQAVPCRTGARKWSGWRPRSWSWPGNSRSFAPAGHHRAKLGNLPAGAAPDLAGTIGPGQQRGGGAV